MGRRLVCGASEGRAEMDARIRQSMVLAQMIAVNKGAVGYLAEEIIRQLQAFSDQMDNGEASLLVLRLVDGPMKGQEYCFDQNDTVLFGRASKVHFLLRDPAVSRSHFLLDIRRPDVARIKDLGSKNHTWINGRVIRSGVYYPVVDGDRIVVGRTQIQVEVRGGQHFSDTERLAPIPEEDEVRVGA